MVDFRSLGFGTLGNYIDVDDVAIEYELPLIGTITAEIEMEGTIDVN
jgi:hypothetical protein